MAKPEIFILFTPSFAWNEEDTVCIPHSQQFALLFKRLRPELELKIVSLRYPFHRNPYRWHGIEVLPSNGQMKKKLGAFLTWVYAYRRLLHLRKQYTIRGILSLWIGEEALIGNRFARKYKIPHFIWISGQDAREGNKHVRRIRPEARQLVAMSDFLKHEFNRNYGIEPMHVLENGIRDSAFPPFNNGLRPIDVIGVGALSSLKNYSAFIDIIYQLKQDHPQIQALIAGDGPERAMLEEKIRTLGLEDNLKLAGMVPHTKVFDYMNQSKCFLHTSHYEGNSNVLIEALYSGCQVASTQPLRDSGVSNLFVSKEMPQLQAKLHEILSNYKTPQNRTVFNTMDATVEKLLALFKL